VQIAGEDAGDVAPADLFAAWQPTGYAEGSAYVNDGWSYTWTDMKFVGTTTGYAIATNGKQNLYYADQTYYGFQVRCVK
jgi:hypothetical protein